MRLFFSFLFVEDMQYFGTQGSEWRGAPPRTRLSLFFPQEENHNFPTHAPYFPPPFTLVKSRLLLSAITYRQKRVSRTRTIAPFFSLRKLDPPPPPTTSTMCSHPHRILFSRSLRMAEKYSTFPFGKGVRTLSPFSLLSAPRSTDPGGGPLADTDHLCRIFFFPSPPSSEGAP